MLVASSLEYICPHEPQKPAVFAATAIPPQIRQAIAKATKAKAGSNTSRASPVISAVMVRGVVPHARQSCAGVEETGHSHRFLWVDAIPFWIIPMPFMQGLYKTFVMAVRLTGPPGGVACHGAGGSRKKASFCIFIGHHHLCILLIINGYLFFACRIECFLFDIERVFLKLFARCMFKALRRKYGS